MSTHPNPTHAGPTEPKAPPMTELEGDHWIEPLRDGTRVLVRPLGPKDREREEAFLREMSPEARHFRFLGTFKEPTPQLVDQLMDVDNDRRMAFVALAHDNGRLREIGVSRYSANADGTTCECAVTVAEDWRHRGLAVLLMQHLIEVARKHGFRQMISIDEAENTDMRDLARYLGFRRTLDPGDPGQAIHTLELRA